MSGLILLGYLLQFYRSLTLKSACKQPLFCSLFNSSLTGAHLRLPTRLAGFLKIISSDKEAQEQLGHLSNFFQWVCDQLRLFLCAHPSTQQRDTGQEPRLACWRGAHTLFQSGLSFAGPNTFNLAVVDGLSRFMVSFIAIDFVKFVRVTLFHIYLLIFGF